MTEPVFLPLMREPQPDTAERKRREVQNIPFALPPRREKWDAIGDAAVWPPRKEERECP